MTRINFNGRDCKRIRFDDRLQSKLFETNDYADDDEIQVVENANSISIYRWGKDTDGKKKLLVEHKVYNTKDLLSMTVTY
jgi:hypothetical protein